MAYSSIVKPTDYFNTVLYTGNGTTNTAQTGVGFQPDWTWIKSRNSASYNNFVFDAVRGATKYIKTDANSAESTLAESLKSFDTDGFTVGTEADVNNNSTTYASWNWLGANGTASNSDGSITSTVSANTTAGFSIVSFTGTGANATIGHGLGVAPNVVITKNRDNARNWIYGGDNIAWTKYMILNLTNASASANNAWNDTAPTSSVVSLGSSTVTNESSAEMIAYCFAEKKGYSKFGSYTGNGNADGTFVYTGMRPAFVMVKQTNTTRNWLMLDNKRNEFNNVDKFIKANTSDAEGTTTLVDFTSNGFKCKTTDTGVNESGGSYIFMAFAENPFVANDSGTAVPVVAR
jgi:hypothetical protein